MIETIFPRFKNGSEEKVTIPKGYMGITVGDIILHHMAPTEITGFHVIYTLDSAKTEPIVYYQARNNFYCNDAGTEDILSDERTVVKIKIEMVIGSAVQHSKNEELTRVELLKEKYKDIEFTLKSMLKASIV